MIYAEFHDFDLAGNLVSACGDRSVIHLDGRLSHFNLYRVAADVCKRRGFVAYRILKGDRLLSAAPVSPVVRVDHLTDLQVTSGAIGREVR